MDKYFEALQKSKGSIALSIADQVGYDGTADVLEKGRAAAMGEIREWNGIKYQKTPKGWTLVKKQEGASETEPSSEFKGREGFKKLSDQLKSNQTAVYCQFTGSLKSPEYSEKTGDSEKGIVNRVQLLSFNPTTKGSFQVVGVKVKYLGNGTQESEVLSNSQAEKLVSCISKIEKVSEEIENHKLNPSKTEPEKKEVGLSGWINEPKNAEDHLHNLTLNMKEGGYDADEINKVVSILRAHPEWQDSAFNGEIADWDTFMKNPKDYMQSSAEDRAVDLDRRRSAHQNKLDEKKGQQQKEFKKPFTLKDFSEDEIENMSWDEFQKTFGKQANDFLRNLDDPAISAIGYGRKSDGTPTDYVVTRSYIPGSDENLEFELQREGGKYGYALMVARGDTEETDEDGDSYWSGDGGKRLFTEGETTYNSAEEAVKALQERIKAVKNGEEIEFERW